MSFQCPNVKSEVEINGTNENIFTDIVPMEVSVTISDIMSFREKCRHVEGDSCLNRGHMCTLIIPDIHSEASADYPPNVIYPVEYIYIYGAQFLACSQIQPLSQL